MLSKSCAAWRSTSLRRRAAIWSYPLRRIPVSRRIRLRRPPSTPRVLLLEGVKPLQTCTLLLICWWTSWRDRSRSIGRRWSRTRRAPSASILEQGFTLPEEHEAEESDLPQIVKVKQFMVKPMSPEEAALQLELVGHDFFVFTDVDTQDTAVVYKRRDGDYGLIEPQS